MRGRSVRLFVVVALFVGLLGSGHGHAHAADGVTARIVGGDPASTESVPWMAAILNRNVANPFAAQYCGGSLVAPTWVVTASHCVVKQPASAIDVVLGVTNLNDITPADRRAVSQVILNPRYKSAVKGADIALLRLAAPANGVPTIGLNSDPARPVLGENVDTYGWGNTTETGKNFPNGLRGVTLTDRAGAAGACGSYGTSYLAEFMMCAGVPGGGKDSCQGDSGGPLVAEISGEPTLVGVTSFGAGCARAQYPGVWTRVSSYADWVNQRMNGATRKVHIGDVTVVEGDSGKRNAFFPVSISPAPATTVRVPYSTVAGTASSNVDYVRAASSLTFKPGQTVKHVKVVVLGDTVPESTESFSVTLGSPTGGAVLARASATGQILNGGSGGLRVSIGDAAVQEGDDGKPTMVKLVVSLSGPPSGAVRIGYGPVVGTAKATDYKPKVGAVTFRGKQTTKNVVVTVLSDWKPEADEQFGISLSVPGGVTGARTSGTITIVNDD